MTDMTTKARGVSLALLMVLSVLAMGVSPAVAQNHTVSVSDESVTAGSQASVSVTLDQAPNGIQTANLTVSLDNASVGNITGFQAGDFSTTQVQTQSDDSITVRFVDFNNDVEDGAGPVDFGSVQVNGSAAGSSTVSVVVNSMQNDDNDDISNASTESGTLTVNAAGDGGDGGDGDGDQDDGLQSDADATLQDGETYWQGQQLFRSAGISANEELELRTDDEDRDLERQITANEDGEVLIDTSGREGDFVLVDDDGNDLASFEVVEQSLDVSWASETVVNDGDETNVDLNVDSNRGSFDVIVTAENLDDDDLVDIFGGEDIDDNGIRVSDVRGTGAIAADFQGISAGTYNFTVEVADTDATDSESIRVQSPGAVTATFEDPTVQQERGDVMEFTVDLQNTNSANLVVGSSNVNYRVALTVTDGDDDDQVTIQMDTFQAGVASDESQVWDTADSDDSITVNRTTNQLSNPLATGDYGLSLSVGGEEKDIGSFFLLERSTTGIDTFTAPSAANFDDVEGLLDSVTNSSEIAEGDYVIFRVEASGLYAYLDGVEDFGQNGLSMTIEQSNPNANVDPIELNVSQGQLFTDPDNNQFFLALQLNQEEVEGGQNYDATFTVGEANPFIAEDESESVSAAFSVENANGEIQGLNAEDELVLRNEASATVNGETTFAPGTEVTVTVRSASATSPYIQHRTVEVQENGSFSADFDLTQLQDGTEFTIRATKGATELDSVQGVIGEPSEQPGGTRTVTVVQPSPTPRIVTVTADGNGGTPVVTERTVTVVRTVESTPTPGQPGFGVAVALVALLAAGLLAIRRRD